MSELITTIEVIQKIGFVGILIVLAIPKLRRLVFNGDENTKTLNMIKDNHLEHLASKLDELIKEERKGNEDVRKLLYIIERGQ